MKRRETSNISQFSDFVFKEHDLVVTVHEVKQQTSYLFFNLCRSFVALIRCCCNKLLLCMKKSEILMTVTVTLFIDVGATWHKLKASYNARSDWLETMLVFVFYQRIKIWKLFFAVCSLLLTRVHVFEILCLIWTEKKA